MDSGLGSDEEQRLQRCQQRGPHNPNSTKEQKQRLNEQLLNGGAASAVTAGKSHCFIDASTLRDEEQEAGAGPQAPGEDASMVEQRRTEERRQGALLFRTSIPQYSTMLQLAGTSGDEMPDTPFNSIVQVDDERFKSNGVAENSEEEETNAKHSLGFYVDLNDVEIEASSNDTSASATTKNIFSMVIDFEAPKKEMPTRLLRNATRRSSKQQNGKKQPQQQQESPNNRIEQITKEAGELTDEVSSNDDQPISTTCTEENANGTNCVIVECNKKKSCKKNKGGEVEIKVEASGSGEEGDRSDDSEPKFVKLSDLVPQNPRIDDICNDFSTARMSRSIPESSWVENSLLMSRSAGFRIAPKPIEPDSTSLTDSTGSQTGPSQRRLGTDLLRMFLEEIDTDTILHVGNPPRIVKAHRCILISRCQYFAGTLRGRSLIIDGFSYESVHFALCHIYSGAAHVPDSINLVELASLADMLSLEGLKEVVAHALKSRHCHHFHSPCAGCLTGVLEVLPLSAAYGLDDLYQRCLRWITSNYLRVWPSRAFASLPKELREKCYQQHVIHMSTVTVLETSLSCDRLLVSLPSLKWAEPVVQLGLQLSNTCQAFVTQHYTSVIPTLLSMEPWNYPRVEEIMLNAAKLLSLEQECSAYARCCHILEKYKEQMGQTLMELIHKLKHHFERRLVSKSTKLGKCPAWIKMDPTLKLHVKTVGKFDDVLSKSTRSEPSRLPRMVSNRTGTSSSESSRNSSPATSQAHASPSLRRSLLLAARAPQVPPSPSTVRRISTLTMPTAASAAKSAPARHVKQQPATAQNTQRPRTAPQLGRRQQQTQATINTQRTTRSVSSSTKKSEPTTIPNNKRLVSSGGGRRTTARTSGHIQNNVSVSSNNKGTCSKKEKKHEQQQQQQKEVTKSPCMQRSSTFLKEEPTVLTHPDQVELS